MALSTRVWGAGKLVLLAGALVLTYFLFAAAAMRLAIRCARDSIPPLRREILLDVATNPGSRPGDVRKRVGRPWRTVKREMESLYMLRLLQCVEEEEEAPAYGEKMRTTWRYSLAANFDRDTLLAMDRGVAPIARKVSRYFLRF